MIKSLGIFSLVMGSSLAFAATAKTYELKNLNLLVGNVQQCSSITQTLEDLATQPFNLLFFENPPNEDLSSGKPADFMVKDDLSRLTDHHYSILSQTIEGRYVHRVGSGSFRLKDEEFHYVIDINIETGDTKTQYDYPLLISTQKGECEYSGVVKPDIETAHSFKKNLMNGVVGQKKDLLTSN